MADPAHRIEAFPVPIFVHRERLKCAAELSVFAE
jgi:hypothetical protein